MEVLNNNVARLAGKVSGNYEKYHNTLGEEFLITNVEISRKSGGVDILPVVISEKLLDESIKSATFVEFEGQVRTFNKDNGSVETYLFAKDVHLAEEGTYINEIKLRGFLCKKGQYRKTFTDRKVVDFILAVNRLFNKSDYLPVIAWGKDAKYISNQEIATEFEIEGRFQSRKYTKRSQDGERIERTAYEISSSKVKAINK